MCPHCTRAPLHAPQALLSQLGGKLLSSHVRYEAALSLALSASSKGVSGGLSARVAVQVSGHREDVLVRGGALLCVLKTRRGIAAGS